MSDRMSVSDLLATIKDGDERGWDAEFDLLRREHGHKIRTLTNSILRKGITKPILIGPDGRVWDGHHRIYIAHFLGFKVVPVEYARGDQ